MATLEHLNELIFERLINQLRGKSTAEDKALIRSWLSESEDNKHLYDELCDIWNATEYRNREEFNSLEALKKVKVQTGLMKAKVEPENEISHSRRILYNLLKIAAVILLVFIAGFYADRIISGHKLSMGNGMTEIKVPIGSKSQVVLPDSTRVWLNSGSTLSYDSRFNQKDRSVYLDGEAYFDVIRNESKLFIVRTEEITVRVLGTTFNIKAYPNEGSVEMTLVDGSLVISQNSGVNESAETILEPDQRATFIKSKGQFFLSEVENMTLRQENISQTENIQERIILSKKVDTDVFTAWKDDRLVFRNEEFESLAIKLGRWYNVKIDIRDDEIKKYHFNGTIVNETVQDVMEIIKYTLPINYSIDHNTITIYK